MNPYDTQKLDAIQPGYLSNYGLREAPFSSIHQDKFLYLDTERAQCLDLLQHMTQHSNLLLMVQGERGAGKTSLLTRFIHNAVNTWGICKVSANTMMDADQLMFQAAQGFGLDQLPQDAVQLQEMLYAHVATMHHNGQVPILIIDDAHELPRDALLAIFNLADTYVDEENLLRIILFCEPQIEKILGAQDVRVLRDRVTHTMEISALDEDGTAEYLKHRLAVAGFTGGSPFTPTMIKRIYKASHGLPGVINELAHETLEHGDFGADEDDRQTDIYTYKSSNKRIAYVIATIALLAVILVFQYRMDDGELNGQSPSQLAEVTNTTLAGSTKELTTEVPAEKPELKQKIIPLNTEARAEKARQDDPDVQQPASSVENTQTAIAGTEGSSGSVPDAEILSDSTTDFRKEQTVTEKPVQLTLQVFSIEPQNITAKSQPQIITINGQGFTPGTGVIVSWTGNQKKLAAQQVSVESETLIKVTINTGKNTDNWNLRVIDPVKGESNQLAFQVTATDKSLSKGDKWVLARSPEAFTLQLFGTNQQKNADQFIDQHAIQGQAAWFRSQRSGQDWYSVVYGEYRDQGAAKSAIQTLPASLKSLKPWVRRFDDIHASINSSSQLANRKIDKPAKIPLAVSPLSKDASPEEYASWLWSQDPRSYTLQLLGARQPTSVKQFLRKYTNLSGKAVYFHTRHDTRDWYTVVYGVYPDRESAKRAIERLPAELKSSSPWIRSFASIHAELDRAE